MGKTRRPASGAMDDVGRRLRRGRVSNSVARLECRAAIRGDSRAGARGRRQRRPQADRCARLYLPRLRHQLRRPSTADLAGLQSARRHGEPHRRVEARSGRRWLLHETVFRHRGRLSRVLLLFNLLAEFQRAAGLPVYRAPATIRTQVLTCGAVLGRAGRRLVLHLSDSWGGLKTRIPLLDSILNWQIPTSPKLEPAVTT